MKTNRKAAVLALGLALLSPLAGAEVVSNEWWKVNFDGPFPAGAELVVGELGNLTNDSTKGVAIQPYASGVWTALDGDESYVTNKESDLEDCYIKLDTQGNDLTWTPTNENAVIKNTIALVDAQLFLVGSDTAPDPADFDGNDDVQSAIFLKNETDEETGETTNSILCVYVYDDRPGVKDNVWWELEGRAKTPTNDIPDNDWYHVTVLVDHQKDPSMPKVEVYVDGVKLHVRGGSDTRFNAANTGKASEAGCIQSVSFRGTGAIDNFIGNTRKEFLPSLVFSAEVYIGDDKILDPLSEFDPNFTRFSAPTEAGEPGSGKEVSFGFYDTSVDFDEPFLIDDFDLSTMKASYGLSRIEVTNFVTGSVEVFRYTYENGYVTPETESENIAINDTTGEFTIKALTDGAKDPTNVVVRIYYKEIGVYKAYTEKFLGGAYSTNPIVVRPENMPLTTNWTFAASEGDYHLASIQKFNGASISYDAGTGIATVSVSIADGDFDADTKFATATYAAGALAEGQELRYTESGDTWTFTPYTPPVAIRVSADGTTTNECSSLRQAIEEYAQDGDTVYLVADDHVSFSATATEIGITKTLTIDGGSNTLYGVTDYAYDGHNDHDIYIGGSGNVTIKNLTLSEFSDTAPTVQYRTYPIWTGQKYAGTLVLDGVTVTNYARTAVNLSGGSFLITNCVFAGYADAASPTRYYQDAVVVFNATGTVANTTVTGVGDANTGYGASVFTVNSDGAGEITVKSGSYTGSYIAAVNSNATGRITIEGGTFVATNANGEDGKPDTAFEPANTVGKIVITGGWFNLEPEAEFLAAGYGAEKAKPDTDPAPWTVVLANAFWIGGANGDWNVPANWDIGLVPTKDTVVTFTNDATVGISPTVCKCKEMVLTNANVTIGRADPGTGADLNFYKNAGSAVSGTGTLVLDTVGLFNQNNSGVLTIGTDLDIQGDVTFKGVKDDNGRAGSWTVTGETTIADGVTVKTIDDAITTFQGDIEIDAGSQVTFFAAYGAPGSNHGGEIVVAPTSTVTLASPATKLLLQTRNDGKITINDSQVVTDSTDYYVKKSSQQNVNTGNNGVVNQTTYEVLPKRTVVNVAATDVTVEGVKTGDRFVPGTNFVITVSGFDATGYEPSVMITNAANDTVLLTTNVASFVYEAPDCDIGVIATKVAKIFDVIWVVEGSDPETNKVAYGEKPVYKEGGAPTKPSTAEFDYEFAGWDPEVVAVTGDATYTAKFTEILRSYAVKFWTNEVDVGEAWFSTNAPYGTLAAAYAPTNDPTKAATTTTNFTFAGWTNAVAGGETVATADLPAVTGAASWLAVWTETPIWKVTFKNGDDTIYETNYLDGATAEYVDETPTKAATAQYAYTFAGWDPALGAVTADTVYAATFSSNAVEYAIAYDLDGGQWPAGYTPTNSYTFESSAIVLPTPVKDGYAFDGWTNALGEAATGVAAGSTGDQSFGAKWTAAALDPVDPGQSMTPDEKLAKPPVAVVVDPVTGDVAFTVHFRGEEGVTYQLVASESCAITEEQWKGEADSGNAVPVGDAKTTANADQDGIIELAVPMSGSNVPDVRFFKIKATR